MRTFSLLKILAVIFLANSHAQESLSSRAQEIMSEFNKTCVTHKKKASTCRCLTGNLKQKILQREIAEEQLQLTINVLKAQPPAENTMHYDNLADLIAGLEHHCTVNPNYSGG